MEYKKNCDTLYEKDSLNDAKQTVSPNNQALKAGGRYSDDCYSIIQKAENNGTQYALDNDDKSGPGPTQWCTWKVTAVVFIVLTALLLVSVLIVGGIWLRESDVLAVSQKTSMEQNKQRQQEEELKRKEREREIRAEEEKKRMEREQEIREEEEKKRLEREREIREEEGKKRMEREQEIREEEEMKRLEREREIRAEEEKKRLEREQEIRVEEEQKKMDLEKEIRQEEEEKREALERLLGERERRLEEVRAQCNSGQMVSSCSTGLSVLLSVLLVNYLLDY
ncbi:hypothetical protein AALO_G00094420 [Alosa alosa]|uniref:Uncharacterized protein n=1 Tax=Alosa alosa TaxID=278164 RepID=A0AAV6GWD1_9TELE|nr:hypothetical protein AALO_G00094420 [Alosa alosa]